MKGKNKLFNDLDTIYSEGMGKTLISGGYQCPVCNLKYKTETGIDKHIAKRSCHNYRHLFAGTLPEDEFYVLYKDVADIYSLPKMSRNVFLKSPIYTMIAKFYVFCLNKFVGNVSDYITFLIREKRYPKPFQVFNFGKKESLVRLFRKDKANRVSPKNPDNEIFFNRNEELIRNDVVFVLRALERGDISYKYLFTKIDMDGFVNRMNDIHKNRLLLFLKTIEGNLGEK